MKGIVKGKTLAGVLLGILVAVSVLFEGNIFPFVVPDIVNTIFGSLAGFFILLGINDAAEQEFQGIKDKLKAFFKKSQAWGLVLNVLVLLTDQADTLDLPLALRGFLQILGAAMIVFDLKGQTVKARLDNRVPTDKHADKYALKKAA